MQQSFRPEDRWGAIQNGGVDFATADHIDELYHDLPNDFRRLFRAIFHVSRFSSLHFDLQIDEISSAVEAWSTADGFKDLETEEKLHRVAAELLKGTPAIAEGAIREDCLIAVLPFVKDVRDRSITSAIEDIVDDRSRSRARLALVRRTPVEERADLFRTALGEFDVVRDWAFRDELLQLAPIELLPELLAARLVRTPDVSDELVKRGTTDVARYCLETVAASKQDSISDKLRFHITVCDHFDLFDTTEDTVRRIFLLVGSTQDDIYAEMPEIIEMLNRAGLPDAAQAIAASVVDMASWWRA